MEKLFIIGIVFLLHFLVFLSLGTLLLKVIKKETYSISLAVILGYFSYFCLFEIVALPCIFLHKSLTFLSWLLLAVLGVAVIAACVVGRQSWVNQIKTVPRSLKEHSWLLLLLLAVVAFQCFFVAIYYDGSADAAYYVGISSSSVYTDTLGAYNPYTGAALKYYKPRYVFSCYPLHNAFVSSVSGIAAIIQAKTIMAVVNAVIANMIYYQIGRLLFRKKSRRYADLMVVFLFVINLYCNTIYLPASFLFTRLYEGKSMLANIVLPMILYCSIRLYQEDGDRLPWLYLFFVNLAAITFSGTSVIAVFACSAAIIPIIFLRRRFKLLVPYILCMLPMFGWALAYVLAKVHVIPMKAF